MKQSKYGLLALMAIAISGIVWIWSLATVASQPTVKIQTEPPLEQVIPDDTVVKFQLRAIDSSQQPFNQASVGVRILTPAPTPWFTSDFPMVEGRELLKLEAIAPQGNLEFEQVLPIRGNYTIEVAVNPEVAGAFEPFEESLTVKVPENAVKYRNLAILALILLTVGFGSGWILGGDRTVSEGEIAPGPVRMLLSGMTVVAIAALLIVNVSAEIAEAGSHKHIGEITSFTPAMEKNEAIQVELSGDRQAVVGKLTTQTVKITNPTTGDPITDVQVSLQSVAVESDALMFAYKARPDSNGQFTWEEQFFDGAPHSVTATVMPLDNSSQEFTPLKVSHEIEVEGIAPPLSVRFISLLYFTLIFVVGLSAGFWIRKSVNNVNPSLNQDFTKF
jgi:hypothetical protein